VVFKPGESCPVFASKVFGLSTFASEVVERIRDVVGPGQHALHEPLLDEIDEGSVIEALRTGYVSSIGSHVSRFEEQLCDVTGAAFAIALSSGTSALQLALQVAGVEAKDEVLVPALSFIATANAVSYLGAVPHFVDVSSKHFSIDPVALRLHLEESCSLETGVLRNRVSGRRVRAIIPMHCFGFPSEITEIQSIARDFGLLVIEDAAEALGTLLDGKHVGTFGDAGIFSFNGNKIATTGGGGAIVTDNKKLAEKARHLSATAKLNHPWNFVHDQIGFNFRMPNLNAALGYSQLQKLESAISSKRSLFRRYESVFDGFSGASIVKEPENSRSNYWLITLRLDREHQKERDSILNLAHEQGLFLRPVWDLLPSNNPYSAHPSASLKMATDLTKTLINLPSSASLVARD
jgi:perosamine synthetase